MTLMWPSFLESGWDLRFSGWGISSLLVISLTSYTRRPWAKEMTHVMFYSKFLVLQRPPISHNHVVNLRAPLRGHTPQGGGIGRAPLHSPYESSPKKSGANRKTFGKVRGFMAMGTVCKCLHSPIHLKNLGVILWIQPQPNPSKLLKNYHVRQGCSLPNKWVPFNAPFEKLTHHKRIIKESKFSSNCEVGLVSYEATNFS